MGWRASAVGRFVPPRHIRLCVWLFRRSRGRPPRRCAAAPARSGGGGAGRSAPFPNDARAFRELPHFTGVPKPIRYGPADCFPAEIPPAANCGDRLREANINACASVITSGKVPENAGVAGLPYEYFVQTMLDFKNDLRRSADPRKANTNRMIAFAKGMTDEEIAASARYYASIPWTPWIRVVEARMVPKTRTQFGVFFRLPGNETEPLAFAAWKVRRAPNA